MRERSINHILFECSIRDFAFTHCVVRNLMNNRNINLPKKKKKKQREKNTYEFALPNCWTIHLYKAFLLFFILSFFLCFQDMYIIFNKKKLFVVNGTTQNVILIWMAMAVSNFECFSAKQIYSLAITKLAFHLSNE